MTPRRAIPSIHYWLPLLVWAGLILAVSSVPGPTLAKVGFSIQDTLAHAGEYTVLGFLGYRLQLALGRRPFAAWLLATAVSIGLGAIDESYQRLIPGRTHSTVDWAADALGASFGAAVGIAYYALIGRLGATSPETDPSPEQTSPDGEKR